MSQGELMLSASADEEISRIAESLSLSESNTADTVVDDVDEETMKQRTCELRKLVEGKEVQSPQLWMYSTSPVQGEGERLQG